MEGWCEQVLALRHYVTLDSYSSGQRQHWALHSSRIRRSTTYRLHYHVHMIRHV